MVPSLPFPSREKSFPPPVSPLRQYEATILGAQKKVPPLPPFGAAFSFYMLLFLFPPFFFPLEKAQDFLSEVSSRGAFFFFYELQRTLPFFQSFGVVSFSARARTRRLSLPSAKYGKITMPPPHSFTQKSFPSLFYHCRLPPFSYLRREAFLPPKKL